MSMLAKFAQVTEPALKKVLADPESVEGLFHQGSPLGGPPQGPLPQDWQTRAPKLMAHALALQKPEVREALHQRLTAAGIRVPELSKGGGGPELMKLMMERLAKMNEHMTAPVEGRGSVLSLEKAWHGVHYLLCGLVDEGPTIESQAVAGGTEFGEDLGYGPARYHRPARVAEIAAALNREGLEAEMIARFDPARMMQLSIYPNGWETAGEREWLLDAFRQLRDFYRESAIGSFAVVTAIE
jgi:hypothetical protein